MSYKIQERKDYEYSELYSNIKELKKPLLLQKYLSLKALNNVYSSFSTPQIQIPNIEQNQNSITTNIIELIKYTNNEENSFEDNIIELKTIKQIKIKIGKIEPLVFQSIEDKNGYF